MPGTRIFFAVCVVIAALLAAVLMGAALGGTGQPVSDAVAAGYGVWRGYGCEQCHTIYGHGGVYAPDLTHIYTQRGEGYINEFLLNPAAFHPGARQMPIFTLTRTERENLFAFLAWVGETDVADNWPPRQINVAGGGGFAGAALDSEAVASDDPVERGRALFSRAPALCSTCHSLEPDIVVVGPSLNGIATRAETRVPGQSAEEYIRNSIVRPGDFIVSGFPNAMAQNLASQLSSQDISDIIAFLMTMDGSTEGQS